MNKWLVCLVAVILCPGFIAISAAQQDAVASSEIPAALPVSESLTECFVDLEVTQCSDNSPSSMMLNWWSWSDETGSNWPDDDAKARAGEIGINVTQNNSVANINQQSEALPIIELTGNLNLISELDGYRIEMPIEMTPNYNLTDSTIMYIFLTKDNSVDVHGRQVTNLIYEMKPEIGFSNQANNTTSTTWILAESHLSAAGVDIDESPYDWQVTFALFGGTEQDNNTRLLSLHQVRLETQTGSVEVDDFLVPILVIAFAVIIISTILGNMYKEEHGMPIITGYWHREKDNCLVVEFTTKNQKMEIKSCEAEVPWKMSSRFKSRFIEPNQSVEVELKFKQLDASDCRLNIRLEVEELGVWTQFLSIPSILSDEL